MIEVLVTIFIILFFGGIITYVLVKHTGNETANLDFIESKDRKEILELLKLPYKEDEVELVKIETPKIHNNIFYKIYFLVNSDNEELNENFNEVPNQLHVTFEKKGETENKILYCCTISDYENNIYSLDKICYKYNKAKQNDKKTNVIKLLFYKILNYERNN